MGMVTPRGSGRVGSGEGDLGLGRVRVIQPDP